MTTEMSGAISSLLNFLLKFKNTGEDKKFIDMQTEISALLLSLSMYMYDKFSDYCVKMAEADDTWKFWNIFTDNIMLPYLLLWYGMRFANWNFRVAAIKLIAPISHALDRTSYLRILPRHIADIHCLPQSTLHHFQMGGFVVNLTGKPFYQ